MTLLSLRFVFTLVIQKSPTYLVRRCLEPRKAEPQEMFGGSNTYSAGVWMSRVKTHQHKEHKSQPLWIDFQPKEENQYTPEV